MRYARLVIASMLFGGSLFVMLACNKEKRAEELWRQAQGIAVTDKSEAIRLAEEAIVTYPNTAAAELARKQVPYWLHASFYDGLKAISNDLQAAKLDGPEQARELSSRLSSEKLVMPLVRILEDYPAYELGELVELQIVAISLWEPVVEGLLSYQAWTSNFNRDVEIAIQTEGSYEEQVRARTQLLAKTMREFKQVMSEMATASSEAGRRMDSLSDRHSLRSTFAEGGRLLKDGATIFRIFAEALDDVIEFYEEDAVDCTLAANSVSSGFFDRLGRSWTLRGCEKSEEQLREKFEPIAVEIDSWEARTKEWMAKSNLEEYVGNMDGLERLKSAVREPTTN